MIDDIICKFKKMRAADVRLSFFAYLFIAVDDEVFGGGKTEPKEV